MDDDRHSPFAPERREHVNSWDPPPDDDEPVDIVEVARDDELLDLLAAGLPVDTQKLSAEVRAVFAMLVEWRDSITWFPDTGTY